MENSLKISSKSKKRELTPSGSESEISESGENSPIDFAKPQNHPRKKAKSGTDTPLAQLQATLAELEKRAGSIFFRNQESDEATPVASSPELLKGRSGDSQMGSQIIKRLLPQ